MTLTIAARLKRMGMATKLLARRRSRRRAPTQPARLLAQAHRYRTLVLRGDGKLISALAEHAGVGASYFARVLRLAFLARTRPPRSSAAAGVNPKRLSLHVRLPIGWKDPAAALGVR